MSRALNDGESFRCTDHRALALRLMELETRRYSTASRPIPADRFYSRAIPEQIARFHRPSIQVRQKTGRSTDRHFRSVVRASCISCRRSRTSVRNDVDNSLESCPPKCYLYLFIILNRQTKDFSSRFDFYYLSF